MVRIIEGEGSGFLRAMPELTLPHGGVLKKISVVPHRRLKGSS